MVFTGPLLPVYYLDLFIHQGPNPALTWLLQDKQARFEPPYPRVSAWGVKRAGPCEKEPATRRELRVTARRSGDRAGWGVASVRALFLSQVGLAQKMCKFGVWHISRVKTATSVNYMEQEKKSIRTVKSPERKWHDKHTVRFHTHFPLPSALHSFKREPSYLQGFVGKVILEILSLLSYCRIKML